MLAGFSVSNVGHCHPAVVSAIAEQSQQLIHYFDLPNEPRERLADAAGGARPRRRPRSGWCSASPAPMRSTWGSGSPAGTPGRRSMLSAYGGYHGTTCGTMATTAKGGMWAYFYPVRPARHRPRQDPVLLSLPLPGRGRAGALRRGMPGVHPPDAAGKETPFGEHAGVYNVAAVLVEPMQASAGYIIPGDGYLRGIRELCDELGFLLIDDEIQAGMGRTGRMWACEHEDVVPDMIVVSKGMASGLPISAVVARRRDRCAWGPGAHVGTFAATRWPLPRPTPRWTSTSPSSWRRRGRPRRVLPRRSSRACSSGTRSWAGSTPAGCSSAWSSCSDRATKEPADEESAWMLDYCVREGLLFEKRRLLLQPVPADPVAGDLEDEIDRALAILDRAMTMAEQRSGIAPARTAAVS